MGLRNGPFGRIRFGPHRVTCAFVWDDADADSYILQIGSASGLSDVYNENVGAVLMASVYLVSGATYYARIVPVVDGEAGTPGTEQTVTL